MGPFIAVSLAGCFGHSADIASRHVGKFPYLAVIWSIANFAVWLSLWPLVIFGYIPLWLGFLIATVSVTLSYLPSHEAQHDIIARPSERLRWLNELVGWIGAIPLVITYPVLKVAWCHLQARQPRGNNTQADRYAATLERLGREDLIPSSIALTLAYHGFLFAMAWSGFAPAAGAPTSETSGPWGCSSTSLTTSTRAFRSTARRKPIADL